jgi:hypothetical protein
MKSSFQPFVIKAGCSSKSLNIPSISSLKNFVYSGLQSAAEASGKIAGMFLGTVGMRVAHLFLLVVLLKNTQLP